MTTSPFFFKKFSILHDKSAMKVGTDAILVSMLSLNLINNKDKKYEVLDIGTGCGVIALILAQNLQNSNITAIDIDSDSVNESLINFKNSPWKERLACYNKDLDSFTKDHLNNTINKTISTNLYDIIISNPPYFVNSLKSKNNKRNKARHTDMLPFNVLAMCVSKLLNKNGKFFCILPFEATKSFLQFATINSLYCYNFTKIYSKVNDINPKRAMLAFCKDNTVVKENNFYIYLKDNVYTNEYLELTKDLLFINKQQI
ncbi:MAG: tRNA1(Val) (adenine(37)-N6)-methyltransferase [Bacteroidales bacterium]|jgi:tRNA1Val (adenine37-N6)-methyltransferase